MPNGNEKIKSSSVKYHCVLRMQVLFRLCDELKSKKYITSVCMNMS